jgi:hypothetical protein
MTESNDVDASNDISNTAESPHQSAKEHVQKRDRSNNLSVISQSQGHLSSILVDDMSTENTYRNNNRGCYSSSDERNDRNRSDRAATRRKASLHKYVHTAI